MSISTISSKGQITLPARLRRQFGMKEKARVFIEAREDGILIRPTGDFFALKGFLGKGLPAEKERELAMEHVARHVLGKSS